MACWPYTRTKFANANERLTRTSDQNAKRPDAIKKLPPPLTSPEP